MGPLTFLLLDLGGPFLEQRPIIILDSLALRLPGLATFFLLLVAVAVCSTLTRPARRGSIISSPTGDDDGGRAYEDGLFVLCDIFRAALHQGGGLLGGHYRMRDKTKMTDETGQAKRRRVAAAR